MAKSKKDEKTPSVKVEDLSPEKDPKGGSLNFSKIHVDAKMQKGMPALKLDKTTNLAITDSALKFHK